MQIKTLNFEQAKILIIGDVMLDQYWHGDTSRISPESPVPVVHVNRVVERPGGAANVALGVAALGAHATLLGLVGKDAAGSALSNALTAAGVKQLLEILPEHATITKLRVLSRHQQMIRLDTESPFLESSAKTALHDQYIRILEDVDLVILSDYGKGTLSESSALIAKARAKNIPVIVDPKSHDYSVYRGASIITPNLKEFEAVAGPCPTVDCLVEKARDLLSAYQIDALVVTRGEHGLSIISAEGEATHIPAIVREVHDVTGAGDTVIAVLGSALASGLDLVSAATLGNIAAGIAVGKLGAATVSVPELEMALGKKEDLTLGVMAEDALLSALKISKAKGERIVFTNGCFDILHAGHVMYLEQASRLGDRVIVAVNDDASVSKLKGSNRPINTLSERMNVLAGLRSVDWVVAFSEDTPERLIRTLSPDVLVKGGDYKDIMALPGAQFVLSQGGVVKVLGLKPGASTTQVIETIAALKESATAV
ncbi:MAG TPA: bifunctional D-glycero-beta-D-manno-heptose-7-phosphate kinase/D-glycero-beta-D-manno-heptose 1-phosphate adenylyltransferase HldE [Gammaproteobacteria bacterium]|nr:bifunctional D-glycero-beta-D-manno-heptose-7-phosphate kinase/D-glycero-beta-D-manno-heptose 1-phosphate adenylyltransferase HldE [Gammaproteobacteria bacterium]